MINTQDWCWAFDDISSLSAESQNYIIAACNMWIMWVESDWITPQSSFNPKSIVTKAEVGTVLSRILRDTEYNNTDSSHRYTLHLILFICAFDDV